MTAIQSRKKVFFSFPRRIGSTYTQMYNRRKNTYRCCFLSLPFFHLIRKIKLLNGMEYGLQARCRQIVQISEKTVTGNSNISLYCCLSFSLRLFFFTKLFLFLLVLFALFFIFFSRVIYRFAALSLCQGLKIRDGKCVTLPLEKCKF